MPQVRIERGVQAHATTRAQVAPGQIFRVYKRDGSLGRKVYAHLGSNGKFYSVNVDSKEIASTRNNKSRVEIVGTFQYNQTQDPAGRRETTRGNVRDGEMFTVGAEPGALYLHMGRKKSGEYLSVNLVTFNIASTANAGGRVTVVGKGSIAAKVAR